jgi:hypothetical protein
MKDPEMPINRGSISREEAARRFAFLAESYPGRRAAIREFTHRDPDFVFWIHPDGRLLDARDAHRCHPPKGFEWILEDEPDYGGFLRGRVASLGQEQLIVVYCRPEALAAPGEKLEQLLRGLRHVPVPLRQDALVISDNGDLYGILEDIRAHVGFS